MATGTSTLPPSYGSLTLEEAWILSELRQGNPADFNFLQRKLGLDIDTCQELLDLCNDQNPSVAEHVPSRTLTSTFIKRLLTDPLLLSMLPYQGIEIIGASIKGDLVISDMIFELPLTFSQTEFTGLISFNRCSFGHSLTFTQCLFWLPLRAFDTFIGHSLLLANSTFKSEVDLRQAYVTRKLDLCNVTAMRKLDMGGICVGTDLLIFGKKAIFYGSVHILGAKIGGVLETGNFIEGGATFEAQIDMGGIEIEQSLLMDGSCLRGAVKIIEAKVGDKLSAQSATFTYADPHRQLSFDFMPMPTRSIGDRTSEYCLELKNSAITYALLFSRATFALDLNLAGALIGGNCAFARTRFLGTVNMVGTVVSGGLQLVVPKIGCAEWGRNSSLVLTNAKVGVIEDNHCPDAWPAKGLLELEGLRYDSLGKRQPGNGQAEEAGSSGWYIDWLRRYTGSSPQPYQQAERWFRETGNDEVADAVLFASRERDKCIKGELIREILDVKGKRSVWSVNLEDLRSTKERWLSSNVGALRQEGGLFFEAASLLLAWFGLWALRLAIGYGVGRGYLLLFPWIGGLTLAGALFIILFGGASCVSSLEVLPGLRVCLEKDDFATAMFYSLDQLLPIVELDRDFEKAELSDSVRYYFYIHKLIGWVLASFLVAALAGLTQKR